MRGTGIAFILITIILMALPIYALVDDPIKAVRGAVGVYILFVFIPIGFGIFLICLSFRRKNSKDQAQQEASNKEGVDP